MPSMPFQWTLRARQWTRLVVIIAAISTIQSQVLNLFSSPETPGVETQENFYRRDLSSLPSLLYLRQQRVLKQPVKTSRDLETALKVLVRRRPSESTIHKLLSPVVTGEGVEGLYDVGDRVRQFTTYFRLWTDLHYTKTLGGKAEIRDDVLQYVQSHPEFALSLGHTPSSLIGIYEAYQQFIYAAGEALFPLTPNYNANHMKFLRQFSKRNHRGIVLTGGNGHIGHLLTNVGSLRHLGCTLPIEILYNGDDDMNKENRAKLAKLPGVVIRDLSRLIDRKDLEIEGFTIKPFAILYSTFREALFIDADALFLRDPTCLFDDPGYVETGALFFKDRMIFPESKKELLEQLLPLPISHSAAMSRFYTGQSGHYQESGVIVVDKWQHYIPLMLTCRLNALDHEDIEHFMYGDKESFWIGWEMAGSTSYSMHNGSLGAMGSWTPFSDEPSLGGDDTFKSICSPQLLHSDRYGKPLWFNGWIADSKHDEEKKRKVSVFNSYVYEPSDTVYVPAERGEEDPWRLLEGNSACLSSHTVHTLTEDEMSVLDMLKNEARKAGEID